MSQPDAVDQVRDAAADHQPERDGQDRVPRPGAREEPEHPGSLEDETEEPVGTSDNHLADTATATLDREIDFTLGENSEQVLAEIDDALQRIEDGTFGTCRTCGQPIAPQRLEAMPWATQCIDCKRKEERG